MGWIYLFNVGMGNPGAFSIHRRKCWEKVHSTGRINRNRCFMCDTTYVFGDFLSSFKTRSKESARIINDFAWSAVYKVFALFLNNLCTKIYIFIFVFYIVYFQERYFIG